MSLDRNAQSLDRLRRVVQQIAAGGSGSTALADNSLISTSTGIRVNLNSTAVAGGYPSVTVSTIHATASIQNFGCAAYLGSTGASTGIGNTAVFAQFQIYTSTAFSSTSLWQGSTLLCSTSTSGGAASTDHVMTLSTVGSTVWAILDGAVLLTSTFTIPANSPYTGFFAPLAGANGNSGLTAWEVRLNGAVVFTDLFPGSTYTANSTSLVSQNSTYLGLQSTGVTAAFPIFNTYSHGAVGDSSRMLAADLNFNSFSGGVTQGWVYQNPFVTSSTSHSGLVVIPSTFPDTGGLSVSVDGSTIVIDGNNHLHAILSNSLTSIDVSLPSTVFSTSNGPLTSSGVLTIPFQTQASTLFLAGPSSGAAAAPFFRGIKQFDLGLLSTGDLLSLASTGLTRLARGTAGQVLRVSTNQTTNLIWDNLGMSTKGDLVTLASTGLMSILPVGVTNQFLVANSTSSTGLQWVDLGSSTILGSVLPLSTAGPDHDGGAIYRTDTQTPQLQVRGNTEIFARSLFSPYSTQNSGTNPVSTIIVSTTLPANYFSTGKSFSLEALGITQHSGNNNANNHVLRTISGTTSTNWAYDGAGTAFSGNSSRTRQSIYGISYGNSSTATVEFTATGLFYTGAGANVYATSTWTVDTTLALTIHVLSITANNNGGTSSTSTFFASGLAYN